MIQNPNILEQPIRAPRVPVGTENLKLLTLVPRKGIKWYGNPNANVVDVQLQLPNGYVIRQRETFSFSSISNLGKLIRAAMRIPEEEFISKIDLNQVIGKEVTGDIIHWQNDRGDVYERAKNFRTIDEN